jgi:hypothetical protein
MGVQRLRLNRLRITSQASRGPDLPGPHPTGLPRDNQRPGSLTLPRHSIAHLLHAGSVGPEGLSLANVIRSERSQRGTGISTSYPSITPLGLTLGPDLPWADEPSPGTLGQSAEEILTLHSLLMPAFALV